MAALMKLNDRMKRMDSLMVASNIRKLGRMELLYTCVADLVSFLHRTGMDDLLGGMEHYYDPNDYNQVIYHSKSEDASDRSLLTQTNFLPNVKGLVMKVLPISYWYVF